jgi:hypothetical protein
MTQEIHVVNGVARLIETKVLGEMPLNELAPFLEYRKPVTLPILPENAVFVSWDEQNRRGVLFVERPPTVTGLSLHFDPGNRFPAEDKAMVKNGENAHRVYTLSLPWQYHMYAFSILTQEEYIGHTTGYADTQKKSHFRIDDTGYYWSKEKLQRADQQLTAAAMLNINRSGSICWGNTTAPTDTLRNRIDFQVKNFLSTHFNTHYGWFIPPAYKSYAAWEAASLANPQCWQTWDSYWDPKHKIGAQYTRVVPAEYAARFDPEDARTHVANATDWGVKPPPPVYTVAKAIEWLEKMDEDDRRRFIYAMSQVPVSPTIEAPAEVEAAPGIARVTA